MIDVSLTLRLPAQTTMAALRDLINRIAAAENMALDTKNSFPFHAELTAPLEAVQIKEAA